MCVEASNTEIPHEHMWSNKKIEVCVIPLFQLKYQIDRLFIPYLPHPLNK